MPVIYLLEISHLETWLAEPVFCGLPAAARRRWVSGDGALFSCAGSFSTAFPAPPPGGFSSWHLLAVSVEVDIERKAPRF